MSLFVFSKYKVENIQNRQIMGSEAPFQAGTGRILITQAVVTLIATVAFSFASYVSAYSAFLGGVACLIPSLYAIWRVFGSKKLSDNDNRIFGVMLRTEFVKLGLTAITFAAIFWLVEQIDPIALFSTFIAAIFIGWIEAGLRIRQN